MSPSRRFYLSLLGVVTWAFNASFSIFAILDAISLTAARVSFYGLTISAAALDGVNLCCTGYLLVQFVWRKSESSTRTGRNGWMSILACFLSSILASIVSLVSLFFIKKNSDNVSRAISHTADQDWTKLLAVQFALWALALATQVTFTVLLLSSPRPQKDLQHLPSDVPRDSVISDVREMTPPTSLQVLRSTYAHPKASLGALPSPTFSTSSSQSLKSWRESLQQVVRPVTSRTKLIGRPSLTRDSRSIHSDTPSVDMTSQSDAFDSWDTSHIDPQTRDTVIQSAPSRGTVLETIPGSRPASPAHALDGPFPPSDGRESPALSLPPKIYPDTSRPPSPAVSEAHIHPLFRTESPTPPPAATPGTSIIASPLSGQVIACPPRPYSRMRSNSRTASPSPLMHSHSFTGRPRSASSPSSRSPSPPSREMTPPIPDFVLKSSPRSSFSGRQPSRKTALQPEADR